MVFQARNHNLPQRNNTTHSTAERHGTMDIYPRPGSTPVFGVMLDGVTFSFY